MLSLALPSARLDRWAIGLSGLCLVHCLGTTIVLAMLASAGGFLGAPLGKGIFEHGYTLPAQVGGLGLGIMAGALTLPHDGGEALYTVIGVAILALGHRLNFIAAE